MTVHKEDPLCDSEGLALLRRAFPILPPDPLESHDFLLSLPLRNPDKLLIQAKAVLADQSMEDSGMDDSNLCRPGFGSKRSRAEFELESDSRIGNDDAGRDSVTLDIVDKSEGHVELIPALGALQSAQTVIGQQNNILQQRISPEQNPPPRRSGLPGRIRTYAYKHRFQPGSWLQDIKKNGHGTRDEEHNVNANNLIGYEAMKIPSLQQSSETDHSEVDGLLKLPVRLGRGTSEEELEAARLKLFDIRDPDEFFRAYERLENAKRAIAKEKGLPVQGFSTERNPRPRGSELPGRNKTYEYKHRFPPGSWLQDNVHNVSNSAPCPAQELEIKNLGENEKSNAELLEQMHSFGDKETVLDRTFDRLQERLQIQRQAVQDFKLPEIPGTLLREPRTFTSLAHSHEVPVVRKIGLGSAGGELEKIPIIQEVLQKLGEHTTYPSFSHSPDNGSPTAPSSSSAVLSWFRKSLSLQVRNSYKPIRDAYPLSLSKDANAIVRKASESLDTSIDTARKVIASVGQSLDRSQSNISSCKQTTDEFANRNDGNIIDEEMPSTAGDDAVVPNEIIELTTRRKDAAIPITFGDELHSYASSEKNQFDNFDSGVNVTDNNRKSENLPNYAPEDTAEMPNERQDTECDPLKSPNLLFDGHGDGTSSCVDNDDHGNIDSISKSVDDNLVKDDMSNVLPTDALMQSNQPDQLSNMSEDSEIGSVASPLKGNELCANSYSNKDGFAPEDQCSKGYTVTDDDATANPHMSVLEEMNERSLPEISESEAQSSGLRSKHGKAKPNLKKPQRNSIVRRQSLAGSGTAWNAGVRRSTRIRSRPLAYWKGERFLYGRIHKSLVTVIGIKKYDSPQTASRTRARSLNVKSFVDDEFQNLVDFAAIG